MERVTQQNAASAEESSSAASELSGQAEELTAMIGVFKIEVTSGSAARTALPQAPRGANLAKAAPPKNGRARLEREAVPHGREDGPGLLAQGIAMP